VLPKCPDKTVTHVPGPDPSSASGSEQAALPVALSVAHSPRGGERAGDAEGDGQGGCSQMSGCYGMDRMDPQDGTGELAGGGVRTPVRLGARSTGVPSAEVNRTGPDSGLPWMARKPRCTEAWQVRHTKMRLAAAWLPPAARGTM
jgi:hypothetical protein